MSMNDRDPLTRLTRAGREALNEHLETEKARVLSEAARLSDGDQLSAFDIVNAVDLISVRERGSSFRPSPSRVVERSRSALLLPLAALLGVLAMTAAILLFLLVKYPAASESSSVIVLSILVGATVVAAGVSLLLALRGAQRANRYSRDVAAMRMMELETSLRFADTEAKPLDESWMNRPQSQRATGSFITNWILLENDLRDMGSEILGIPPEDARRYPIGELLRMLLKEGVLSDSEYERMRPLLTLRNAVMHGGEFDADDLGRGEDDIALLRRSLKQYRARRAIRR